MSDKPIEIKAVIVGGVQIEARFLTGRARVKEYVFAETKRLVIQLQRNVKADKLSGQVLNGRPGRLKRSINQRARVVGDQIRGSVGTNVEYGKAWELGYHGPEKVKAHTRTITQAFGHPIDKMTIGVGGFTREINRDARPFLRPSLDEFRPEIRMRLARAAWLGI